MTPPDASASHPPALIDLPAAPWQRALLWTGAPLCVAGMVRYRLWEHWHPGRFGELVLLSLLAWAAGWPLHRFARWSWASALALPWLLALAWFAGPAPFVAVALTAATAIALGSVFVPRQSPALQATCGLVVLGAVLGWLLPLPVHYRWSYVGLCVLSLLLRRSHVVTALRGLRSEWASAVVEAPRTAAWTVLALGLASTGCWLPTMQSDDVGYHLRMPWSLLEDARYALDPDTHAWALAPWLGDVVHSFPQLIAGAEARGPVNALWIVLAGAGVWQLGRALGGSPGTRWLAVALYASLPLTAALAGSMHTETPTTAVLAWLVVLILRIPRTGRPSLPAGAILAGAMLGLKISAGAFLAVLLPWAAWRHRHAVRPLHALVAGALALCSGTSSYLYAWCLAGNPFLPLLNAYFRSPFFPTADYSDLRWNRGFELLLPWKLTFDTGRYLEAFAGGAGFALIALLGAWLLALVQRRTAVAAVVMTALVLLPLVPIQYLRYAFPAMVALLPLLAVSSLRADPRRGAWLLAGVCLLNFAFQANGHWMLRTGALKEAVLAGGADSASFRHYTPERVLLATLRAGLPPAGTVLAMDAEIPSVAEMGARARTVSRYDPSLSAHAASAEKDASGAAWHALLRRERVAAVLSRKATLTAAQRAGLERAQATLRAEAGDAQLWILPAWENEP